MGKLQRTSRAYAIARRHMRAHGAADGIGIGQCDTRMPEAHGLLDELLGVACTGEEGMIALDKQLAPLDIPRPACAWERRGRSIGRVIASVSAGAQRGMEHVLWWRLIGHRLTLNAVVLDANEEGHERRGSV